MRNPDIHQPIAARNRQLNLACFKALYCCAGIIVPAAAQAQSVSALADGGTVFHWDPNAQTTVQNELITSKPGTFTGVDVAALIGANTFYSNGYTGTGAIIRNVEAGHIWSGHETLTTVSSFTNMAGLPSSPFGTPAYDRHATWVGMMMGGHQGGALPGNHQTGIAYTSTLQSGAIASSWSGSAYATSFSISTAGMAYPYEPSHGGFGTADVINSSWGNGGSTAGVDFITMVIDSLANQNRFTTFVGSAGNSGPGSNTVGAPGTGYNGICVGALQNNGSNVYDTVASFSSRGPLDYSGGTSAPNSRIGVDIVAPGTDLTSAFYGGQTGGNDASLAGSGASGGPNFYSGGLAGTSFSSPITAGAVALMHQAAAAVLPVDAEDTRVIKAVLLNSASKIAGWTNGQAVHPNGKGGVRTTQSLDYNSGAGALDMTRTFTQYMSGQTDIAGTTGGSTAQPIGWDYASVAIGSNTSVSITVPLAGELRSTLDWFRERTYTNSTTQTDVGYADLNLEIYDSTFTTLISDSVSLYNEVEHLTFNLPNVGLYGIRATYVTNRFGSITSEEFGLAWWGTGDEWKNIAGNWGSTSNWTGAIAPGAAGDLAQFGTLATTAKTVTVEAVKTVGSITFNNANKYTISGANAVHLKASLAFPNAAINVVNGSHDITAPLALDDNTIVTVTNAIDKLTVTDLSDTAKNLTKAGAGTLEVNHVHAGALSVSAGKLSITPDGTASGTSKVTSVASTGKLDLTNNDLVVTTGGLTPVRTLIMTGYTVAANWSGNGIITSGVAPAGKTVRLGYAQGNDTALAVLGGSLSGQSFVADANHALVKFTYQGDCDLDGDVDGIDVSYWASNFTGSLGMPVATLTPSKFWTQGDWDYDGDTDGTDVSLWAANFTGSGGGVLGFGGMIIDDPNASPAAIAILAGMGITVVPEPASLGLLAILGAGVLARRRRSA